VNGGSQVALPVYVKKFVHSVAVTCFSVATVGNGVGGDVVEGSHAAIASDNVTGTIRNATTEPLGTSPETAAVSVTVVEDTLFAVVPAATFGPKTGMPTVIPLVPPAGKVNVLPDGQSTEVVAVRHMTNVTTELGGTSPETAVLSVTVVEDTLLTVVPGTIFVPKTAMPTLIPMVPPAPVKVNVVVSEGQSAVVVAVRGGIMAGITTNAMTEPLGTSAETAVVSTTVVEVALLTVVPRVIFVPMTPMPPVIPVVPVKVNVAVPDGQSAVVVAELGGLVKLNVSRSVVDTVPVTGMLRLIAVVVTLTLTAVPA
jgi:hypothetical protein